MDLRSFVSELEKFGEILNIGQEVDLEYQVGDRTRQVQRLASENQALMFQRIKGYPGYRVFTNGLGTYSRVAIALGLDRSTRFKELLEVFEHRLSRPVMPDQVKDGPVKENVFLGKEIDLFTLPVPWWNREDGGRYIGTWHLNITNDPETGSRNVGIYRMQLVGSRRTTISFSPKSHIGIHYGKAEKMGLPLEMAVGIGVDEIDIIAAAGSAPFGTDEFRISGGLRQKPAELMKCEIVDLEVPASAEIVLEGNILPGVRIKEGPFLDYSGIPTSDPQACVFEVNCLMLRNDPIFRGAAVGAPGSEDHVLFSLLSRANCLNFHGSRARQKIQNWLLKRGLFGAFQVMGRFRKIVGELLKT